MTTKTQKTQLEVGDLVEVTTYGGSVTTRKITRVTKTKATIDEVHFLKREIKYDFKGRPILHRWKNRMFAAEFKLIES